jgi:hypothetical protein
MQALAPFPTGNMAQSGLFRPFFVLNLSKPPYFYPNGQKSLAKNAR